MPKFEISRTAKSEDMTQNPFTHQEVKVEEVAIEITSQSIAFDKKTIIVSAGAKVTMNFHNQDNGVPHNFALYQDSSKQKAFFKGEIFKGVADKTYRFTAPSEPGSYYFQCDVHHQMNGTFQVK